jgi:hypothetical protein
MNDKIKVGSLYLLGSSVNLTIVSKSARGEWVWQGYIPVPANEAFMLLERLPDVPSFGVFLYKDMFCLVNYQDLVLAEQEEEGL